MVVRVTIKLFQLYDFKNSKKYENILCKMSKIT